jgi:hypothetical protein
MTSLLTSVRQVSNDGGYYVNLADLSGTVFTEAAVLTYLAGGASPNTAGAVSWNAAKLNAVTIGGVILKDMGKTLVAADYDTLTTELSFRKVQLVNNSAGTFGVGGSAANTFFTGYILLGSASALASGVRVAKVAKYGI